MTMNKVKVALARRVARWASDDPWDRAYLGVEGEGAVRRKPVRFANTSAFVHFCTEAEENTRLSLGGIEGEIAPTSAHTAHSAVLAGTVEQLAEQLSTQTDRTKFTISLASPSSTFVTIHFGPGSGGPGDERREYPLVTHSGGGNERDRVLQAVTTAIDRHTVPMTWREKRRDPSLIRPQTLSEQLERDEREKLSLRVARRGGLWGLGAGLVGTLLAEALFKN